jgi:hypothetical protein
MGEEIDQRSEIFAGAVIYGLLKFRSKQFKFIQNTAKNKKFNPPKSILIRQKKNNSFRGSSFITP